MIASQLHAPLALPAPLAVTAGDPAGIGPDIIIAAWLARRVRALPPFVVYGDTKVLSDRAQLLGSKLAITPVASPRDAAQSFDHALPVITVAGGGHVTPGTPSLNSAAATIAAIDLATAAVMTRQARAIVTGPISKAVLYGAGFRHPGHTEYLAHLAGLANGGAPVRAVMMLACAELRVVPATIHIPLAAVPAALNRQLLEETIVITERALKHDFGILRPRIAVAGLNPHAGEGGAIGTEDRDLIAPVVERFVGLGFAVSGPHSADTLFHEAARARYDAAIAMYHDQALIPIKTLAFDRGVNITLGLPFVRTSPDHGTAFDIAGTGRASAESLIAALLMAGQMATMRARNADMHGQCL